MKKQIVAMVTCLIMCSVFVLNGFTSHAVIGQGDDMLDFYVPYSRPEGDGVGYISIVVEQNGIYKLETFVWDVQPFGEVDEYGSDFEACTCWVGINDNNLAIMISNESPDIFFTCNLFTMYYSDSTGTRMDVLKTSILFQKDSGEDWIGYDLNYNNYNMNVLGYEVGGNVYVRDSNLNTGGKFYYPRIHWNQEVGFEVYMEIMQYLARISVETDHLNHIALSNSATRWAVEEIRDMLKAQVDSIEQEKMEQFESSSSTQTNELNSLNQQNQLDKPSVEDVSTQVDSALDFEIDSNYGLLLSSVTGSSRIVTMMLVCAAIGLIAFVFFGKR